MLRRLTPTFLAVLLSTPGAFAAHLRLDETLAGHRCNGIVVVQTAASRSEYDVAALNDVDAPADALAHFQMKDCWAPDVALRAGEDRVAPAFATAQVRGVVSDDPPEALEVKVTLANDEHALDTAGTCGLAKGTFRCTVPKAVVNLRLAAQGRVPRYLWNVDLRARPVLDLGRLRLSRGSSVAGWVNPPRGAKKATVELSTASLGVAAGSAEAEGHYTTTANDNGFFQFTGVADGHYDLMANLDGYSAARAGGIVVGNATEFVVRERLRFPALSHLSVVIQPAVTPGGKPWRYELKRPIPLSAFTTGVSEGFADAAGSVRVDRLPADSYWLQLMDDHGAVFYREQLELNEVEGTRFVRLQHVTVRGSLMDHRDPFSAILTFRARDATNASATTDANGAYRVVLPHGGKWLVSAKSARPPRLIKLGEVDVVPDDSNLAVVDFELPPGKIRGKVVDESGSPVAANVDVLRDGRVDAQTVSDAADGKFELAGVKTGNVFLQAAGGGATSGLIPHDVSDVVASDVTIVITPQRSLRGFLTASDGTPIPGALIRASSTAMIEVLESVTGPAGDFSFSVPRSVQQIDAVVIARDAPAAIVALNAGSASERDVRLVLPEVGGVLRIELESLPPWPMLRGGGGFVSLRSLLYPRGAAPSNHGIVPGGFSGILVAGHYTVCPTAAMSPRCVEADVTPSQVAVVDARRMWSSQTQEKSP